MKKKTVEVILYAIIFCLAAVLRFHLLGTAPLTESEADAALRAFNMSNGHTVALDAQAGYILITSVLFYFMKAGEFWARFLPALAGTLIVLSPLLYRRHLSRFPSIILAAGLAIDPSLIIASRTASGSIFAVTFFLFALGFLINKRFVLAGIFTSLALLGGSSIWFGVCVSILTAAVWFFLRKRAKITQQEDPEPETGTGWKFDWKKFTIGFGITTILIFSVFMTVPEGLGGVFAGLADFVNGWVRPKSMSIGVELWSLLFYEALPVLLGILAIVVALIRRDSRFGVFALAAFALFLLLIVYPGRDFDLFPWLIIPLWALLGKYLLADYSLVSVEKIPYYGLLAVILIALVFGAWSMKGVFTGGAADTAGTQLRIASVLGAILIMLVASGLVIWGWSINTAVKAFLGAVFIGMLVLNVSAVWHSIRSPIDRKEEVWLSGVFSDKDLFIKTVDDYRQWNIGTGNQSTVMISGIDSQALNWSLKWVDKLESVQALPETINPELVITGSAGELQLENEYAGQDFILSSEPVWTELNAWEWFRWFFLRETPHIDKTIILWVRTDQFPGYKANEPLPEN